MAVLVWRGKCPFVEKAANAQAAGAAAVVVVTDETGESLFFLTFYLFTNVLLRRVFLSYYVECRAEPDVMRWQLKRHGPRHASVER